MTTKLYTSDYAGMLPELFVKKAKFLRAFGGAIQVKDGIKNNETFLQLKTTDTDVVIQNYDTGANVGFGTGTSNSTRFGPRKEVKSIDEQVPYEANLAINEGIDDFTVNDIPTQVVAERLGLHAIEWAQYVDNMLGKALSEAASATLTGSVEDVFSDAHVAFVNNGVSENVAHVAYVKPEIYNAIIAHQLTTTAKGSSANIDNQTIVKFKGFVIEELPDTKFQDGENVIFAADGVGVVGIGIQIARAMESEDFAGTALQAAAKFGKYLPEKNNKAILKANVDLTPEG